MTVKDVLNLFFLHPVKGLPVTDDRDEQILGFITKERIIELGSSRSDLELELSDTAGRLLQELNLKNIESFFRDIDNQYSIPVINRKGEIRKAVTKTDLEVRFRASIEPPAPKQVPAATPVPAPETAKAPSADSDLSASELLDAIPAAILVLNPRLIILSANDFFLEKFGMERDFVLRQQISHFFPRIKLTGNADGTFTYGHQKWHYRLRPGLRESVLVFQEIVERTGPSETDTAAEKVLAGKSTLKPLIEQYESRIIRKVCQKKRSNLRQAAELLGLSEENLKYRLHKTK
jgi:PAS domain-containing protein